MRYLLIILAFLIPTVALAVAGQNVRTDFVGGEVAPVADATTNCTDTAKARFDFVGGEVKVVIDTTANCTLAVGGTSPSQEIINLIE